LSGPLLDRVDLRVQLDPPSRVEMLDKRPQAVESTATVAARVAGAREAAGQRYAGTPWRCNGEVPGFELRSRWPLPGRVMKTALDVFEDGRLSARGLDRVLRVCWTLADLAGRETPGRTEMETALRLRVPGLT
jgi:magnesium chelatase family protein